ncbi:MAG: hypothetical protein H6576_15720 [Lewinellaceae bacterium]|nr:hypothetical protein [Saprospiraceae bacterium]MCB9345139.1 hypothetical protein [Lewinellaceae bacterium]
MKFSQTMLFSALLLVSIAQSCANGGADNTPFNAQILPAASKITDVRITDLNCWVEKDQFCVCGICVNESPNWQKIWLQGSPINAMGESVRIHGSNAAIFPTFSSAIAPSGRTSFLAFWPLSDFEGQPDSCHVTVAGATQMSAGPVLLVDQISAVKMLVPSKQDSSIQEEVALQINAVLNNPLSMQAQHPRLELLLFGKDNRLWFTTMLNPEDPQTRQMMGLEREGPMQAGEKRGVGVYAFYERLPKALQETRIGRVEMLAFEER